MKVEAIHRLIDETVTGGALAWVRKTTLRNAYSDFIEKLADSVPEHETPIAIAFEVFNAHANDISFNALCTDEALYVDDPKSPHASEAGSDFVRIPLASISGFSFVEGSLGYHELRFTQHINGVALQSVWR